MQIILYFTVFKIVSQLDVLIQENSRFKANLDRGVQLLVMRRQRSVFIFYQRAGIGVPSYKTEVGLEILSTGALNTPTIFSLSIYRLCDKIL